MGKRNTDYSKGLIYKIKCRDENVKEVYYGSTCNFPERYDEHMKYCNNPNNKLYNKKRYKFIREHGGWNMWTMKKIKDFPCKNRDELEIEEDKYIVIGFNSEGGCLNKNRARRSKKQYYLDNVLNFKTYNTQYKKDNYDKINAKNDCPCGGRYTHKHKSEHCKSKKHLDYLEKINKDETKEI